jgi:chromosome segregation ATPase
MTTKKRKAPRVYMAGGTFEEFALALKRELEVEFRRLQIVEVGPGRISEVSRLPGMVRQLEALLAEEKERGTKIAANFQEARRECDFFRKEAETRKLAQIAAFEKLEAAEKKIERLVDERNTLGGNLQAAAEWKRRDELIQSMQQEIFELKEAREKLLEEKSRDTLEAGNHIGKLQEELRKVRHEVNSHLRDCATGAELEAEKKRREAAETIVDYARAKLADAVSFDGQTPDTSTLVDQAFELICRLRKDLQEAKGKAVSYHFDHGRSRAIVTGPEGTCVRLVGNTLVSSIHEDGPPFVFQRVNPPGFDEEIRQLKRDREQLARRVSEIEEDRERIREERDEARDRANSLATEVGAAQQQLSRALGTLVGQPVLPLKFAIDKVSQELALFRQLKRIVGNESSPT